MSRSALHPTPCNKQSDKNCYDCNKICMKKNIAYKLTCTICGEKYCGETGRYKRNRCWEHVKSVRNRNTDTAISKNYRLKHQDCIIPTEPFKFQILRVCKDYTDRLLWQSLYIKTLNPEINTQLAYDTDSWQKTTWAII